MFLWTPPAGQGWQRVRVVPAGTVLAQRPPRYVHTSPWWQAGLVTPAGNIGAAVQESVARRVHADVPVGLLLSGGLDSTWLGVEMARKGFAGPAFAARSGRGAAASAEPFEDDAPYAARVARWLGLPL